LYHTKYEVFKMYGEDANCPCCNIEIETLDHMLRCGAVRVVKNRRENYAMFCIDLKPLISLLKPNARYLFLGGITVKWETYISVQRLGGT
jgi:hypothetical protein